MKTKTKIMIAMAAACAGTLVLGACAAETPYDDLAERDFTVSVRYDTNGGKALGSENVDIVDTYKLSDVERGVKLLPPDDSRRQTTSPINIERSGYFLAGWYAVREYRTDADGNPLNENGDPAEKPVGGEILPANTDQGWMYQRPWDFEKDVFRLDDTDIFPDGAFTYESGKVAFTLYAAWIPEFTYRVLGEDEEGDWQVFAEYSFNPLHESEDGGSDMTLSLPAWDESTGTLDYGKLSLLEGVSKTFVAAYGDPEKTRPVARLEHNGTWDRETGVSVNGIMDVYADWEDGIWYHVNNEAQLVANAGGNRSFDIRADLDFSKEDQDGKPFVWPAAFSSGEFTGVIRGNGHTISNVTVEQTSLQDTRGGLFGTIGETAEIERLTFTNVVFRLNAASSVRGTLSMFGLFAGEMSTKATMTGVSVRGNFVVGSGVFVPSSTWNPDIMEFDPPVHYYDVGILTGNLATNGIDYQIELSAEAGKNATKNDDGSITITVNLAQ